MTLGSLLGSPSLGLSFNTANNLETAIMKTKICNQCKEVKELSKFNKERKNKDGYQYFCKACDKKRKIKYNHTIEGLVSRIYNNQKRKSERRLHPYPNYSKNELLIWMVSCNNFTMLYADWVNSNYNTDLIPSCDRVKDNLPYTLDNLQLITWEENNRKARKAISDGTLKRKGNPLVPVIRIDLSTGETKEYISVRRAALELNIHSGNICSCCKGVLRTSGGYKWEYKLYKKG
jgi:hypothetical protein